MKNIVLIGIMGSGKSTVSRHLGDRLGRPVVEMDDYVMEKFHQTIHEMFAVSEDYFRDCETEAVRDIAKETDQIISTGGGVILRDENIDLLRQNGIIFFLDRPLEDIVNDVDTSARPLLKDGPEKLYALAKARKDKYLAACDVHIINDGTYEECVEKILNVMEKVS